MEAPISGEVEVIDLTGLSDSDVHSEGEDDNVGERGEENQLDADGQSEGSEIEIMLNAETRSQLQAAISTVSEARLRNLLRTLVETEKDPTFEAVLTRELVTLNRETHQIVARWETCLNCNEDYDINTAREEDECNFHPGDLETIEDSFADWDPAVHGPMDTPENRNDFPENFMWSCCEGSGYSEGCVHGEHKPAAIRKRKRLE